MSQPPVSILFVCLGNICRSPMAETVCAGLVAARADASRFHIDSAGTGDWHVGKSPDERTLNVLREHGLTTRHRGRQVNKADFSAFSHIFAMDRSNLANLTAMRPAGTTADLRLLGEYDPQGVIEVPDPYYDDLPEFRAVHDQVERCLRAFLATITP